MAGRCAGDRVGLGAVAHAEWRQGVVSQEGLELDNWSRWRRRFTKLVLHLRLLAGGGRNRNQD